MVKESFKKLSFAKFKIVDMYLKTAIFLPSLGGVRILVLTVGGFSTRESTLRLTAWSLSYIIHMALLQTLEAMFSDRTSGIDTQPLLCSGALLLLLLLV